MAPSKAGTLDFVQINAKPYRVLGYKCDSIPGVPPPVRSGPLSYADRQGEETSSQGTWHHGFGRGEIRASQSYLGRVQDPEDIGRYHYSQNVDARFRGQMILGPLLSTTTNVFTETFANLTQWTAIIGSLGSVSSNTLTAGTNGRWQAQAGLTTWRDGRWSASVKQLGTGTDISALIGVGKTDGTNWASGSNILALFYRTGANTVTLALYKTITSSGTTVASQTGLTWTDGHSGWIELEAQGTSYTARLYTQGSATAGLKSAATLLGTVTGTISDSALSTVSAISLVNDIGVGVATQWGGIAASPGGVYVGDDPLDAKVQFIQYNGSTYALGARYIHILSGQTVGWRVVHDLGASAAAVKGCATVFGSKLYIADGNTTVVSYDGSSWANALTGLTNPILAQTVGMTMWVVSNKNQLQSTTDGSTLATAISCGSGVDVATALVDYGGFPYVIKPDGVFFYDGQNLWNVYPELARRINSANGSGSAVGRGTIFIPFGPQVVGYSADLITPDVVDLLPDRAQGVEARGTFVDFSPDADFLWGCFKSQGGNYYITTYDFNPTPGQGWHQVVKTGTTTVTAISVISSSSAPFVLYSEGTTIKNFLLAQNSVNPFVDTNYRYGASGDIYLSQEVDDFDDIKKSYISLVLDTAGCAAGQTVVIKYTLDAAAEATLTTVTTNGPQEIFFPAGTTGKRLSLHLNLTTNDSTKTPQVFPIAKRYKRRYNRVGKWTVTLDCARSNQNVTQDPLTSYTNLIACANTTDGVAFTDVDGTAYTAFVEEVNDKTDPTKQSDQNEKIVEVVLSQKRTS